MIIEICIPTENFTACKLIGDSIAIFLYSLCTNLKCKLCLKMVLY